MTTETDSKSSSSGKNRAPDGKSPERTSPAPEIHMNMPDRDSESPGGSGHGAGGGSPESIERLLLKLMGRLDENDRHYGQALDNLNNRLNTLSQRARAASTSSPAGPAATLERVHEQASSLAAQVNDAGTAHKAQQSSPESGFEQRLSTLSSHLEGGLPPGPKTAVNDDFADVTQRLERSLASGAPANEFDALTNRMDDLARHLDAALESRSDPGTLQSIEARLDELARSFVNAQQQYARIEDIEGHLRGLINWTQSANVPANDENMYSRLDAVERALRELNDNARAMDDRSASTLEALNEAVEPAPSRGGSPRGPVAPREEALIEIGETEPPQAASGEYATGDYADVWTNETQEPNGNPEPGRSRSRPAPASHELGANIPDYQPEPAASPVAQSPERRGGKTDRRARSQDRVEPAYEEDNDFIASARRAAAAAAQAPEPGAVDPRASRAEQFQYETDESSLLASKRPRPIYVAAAVGLFLVSAGILFGKLKSEPEGEAKSPVQMEAPRSPAPKAPAEGTDKQSLAPAAGTAGEKLNSRLMAPGQRPPGGAERAAPVAAPAPAPATPASYTAPPPAREALPLLPPQQSVTTSTLLAALTQQTAPDLLPGVKVTIKEPPAPRARSAPPLAAPALVPPAAVTSRPNLLALPKRARATPGNRTHRPTQPIDSAPAGSTSQPIPSRSAAMPPLRIGPQSLRVAAARGNPAAQVEVASRFAKGTGVAKNLKKAAQWYGRAAAQGFAPAQYHFAALYERGLGVKKDIAVARTWYRRAAELGNIRAMHNLAVLHTRTKPDRPDYTAAKNWFYEAASRGLADSQFNLGVLYESGLGVRRNAAEAYKWFTLAARQGDDEARKRRETIRPKLPARSLSAVEQTLRSWKPVKSEKAANKTGQPRGGWQTARLPHAVSSTGPATIARAQKLLNNLGYDAGLPDGKLGPRTIAAIRRFENRTGVPVSGKVTPTLLQQLGALNG